MLSPETDPPYEACETAAETVSLQLYVAGASSRSLAVTERVQALCDWLLPSRYQLKIFDLYENPSDAHDAGILGAPALVKVSPGPRAVLVGDLRDPSPLLDLLGVAKAGSPA